MMLDEGYPMLEEDIELAIGYADRIRDGWLILNQLNIWDCTACDGKGWHAEYGPTCIECEICHGRGWKYE